MRITRDELGLGLALLWSKRGTCLRRQVGCVLFDEDGRQIGQGYNGASSGSTHCTDLTPCPGAKLAPGTGLEACQAIHAEQNALIFCPDPMRIDTCYVTASPCVTCVKMLMNTSCRRIVFIERYAHDSEAHGRWIGSWKSGLRTWEQGAPADLSRTLFEAIAHGDQAHRDWLEQAIEDHFAGRPVRRPQ